MSIASMSVVWTVSLIVTVMLLPVGVIRLLAHRSGDLGRDRGMGRLARSAVAVGVLALVVCAAVTVWFLANGQRPWGGVG